MAALDALNEDMGSNKTSISKYIESKYPNLPSGHTTLLGHHLNRMKDTGELIFWKNNYMKPNPNFIRRGRGRPRKEPGFDTSPQSKPRGRLRNDDYGTGDNLHVKKTKASSSENGGSGPTGRPGGRPPKAKLQMGFGENFNQVGSQ